nr:MAG TPA: hypothetical protein [Caudoviricetes sp.]
MLTTVLAYFCAYKKAVARKFRTTAFSLFCFFQLAVPKTRNASTY